MRERKCACVCSRAPVRAHTHTYVYIKGDLLWVLAHVVMETEKSHRLPHTSRRPASWWYNSVWVQRPEKAERGASGASASLGLNFQNQELRCLRAEGRCASSSWEGEFALFLPFCSIQALSGSGGSSYIAEGDLPYSVSDSNANFFPKHPRKHTQKQCFINYLGIL